MGGWPNVWLIELQKCGRLEIEWLKGRPGRWVVQFAEFRPSR